MNLVITEKPSVAMSIAKVIGANNKKDGYYEGNGYKVSWCVGHLIQLANPDAYDEKYAKWDIKDLPIMPNQYKYDVSKNTKKQFLTLKKLMNDNDIKTIINACDAGREGELIFRLVYEKVNCKKTIKRLWISSMEESAIRDGFNNLKDGIEYDNLFRSAQARSIADWLVGINLSRLYSILYNINYSVGRVQTPTLNMIVSRNLEINNFKKEKYYTVSLDLGDFSLKTDRINDFDVASTLLNSLDEKINITDVQKEEKKTNPDLPFDLTTLQRECNKYFGYSAKQTLDYAQSLYEKKFITYPRTDSRYLTIDMIDNIINNVFSGKDFNKDRIKVVFNSSKVTDHHAIIPTISSLKEDVCILPESEEKVYKLILNKFYSSMGYPLIQNTTKILYEFNGFNFKITGNEIISEGFTTYLKEYKKNTEIILLPSIEKGQEFRLVGKNIDENYTKPPKQYTEDTLLKAMENAGKEYLDKDIEIERSGLGTPATRAGIIENLISKGFVTRDKKNLIPTQKGISLITIVGENIKSSKMTANWEMKLSEIASGKYNDKVFLQEIEDEIVETIKLYKGIYNA